MPVDLAKAEENIPGLNVEVLEYMGASGRHCLGIVDFL
jgi:hypothetical protein